jgi:hypothetical protein
MVDYLKRHEAFILETLAADGDCDWEALARFHGKQLAFMQHERLIHLLVTLSFGLFALLTMLTLVLSPRIELAALTLLLLGLLVPYVAHYFKLENGVQRWYHLANAIDRRAGQVAREYRDSSV